MIIDFWVVAAGFAGAVFGFGVYLALTAWRTPEPALGPALRRLHSPATPGVPGLATPSHSAADKPWWGWIDLPKQDLEILNRTPQAHATTVVSVGFAAMLLPGLVAVGAVIVRAPFSPAVPLVISFGLAALGGYLTHRSMRTAARAARSEFVRALCTYVTLAAHQVRAGHGAVEAMERAARICQGWPYVRLRSALLTAQLQMTPPWDELRALALAVGVDELSAYADIMRSAGSDGAQVYRTLRAQAESLRDQARVRALEDAKKRSSKLDIPATMLVMVLLALAIFPIMANLFAQT
ncbi:MAG: secretion system protein [Hamadaea sp.]|uniref:type II secretion system F family protein n=1 Tax=Hamadaea sp. TaxID=2024425 RepID=UPI0017F37ABE|nr:type II secretion system F family protein [Hamadaea sp.]NUR72217.1 secretion system protein [Hamadaea sp.]NUT22110.1 secretion system protein [Hamadaea sp.]